MKTNTKLFLTIAGLALAATTAMAQTTWTGNVDSNYSDAGNWDNGLPSVSNIGEINIGDLVTGDLTPTSDGVDYITLNGGTITSSVATRLRYSTINAGTVDWGSLQLWITDLTINGGDVSFGAMRLNGGALTVTGGTVTAGQYRSDARTTTLGVGAGGSMTFTSLLNTTTNFGTMDWLSGSSMTVSIASANWAETVWNNGNLRFNGQSTTDLGNLSWADATNSAVGLGGGEYFDWDGTTNTLALAIPEPSTLALLGIAGLAAMAFRRRRK